MVFRIQRSFSLYLCRCPPPTDHSYRTDDICTSTGNWIIPFSLGTEVYTLLWWREKHNTIATSDRSADDVGEIERKIRCSGRRRVTAAIAVTCVRENLTPLAFGRGNRVGENFFFSSPFFFRAWFPMCALAHIRTRALQSYTYNIAASALSKSAAAWYIRKTRTTETAIVYHAYYYLASCQSRTVIQRYGWPLTG